MARIGKKNRVRAFSAVEILIALVIGSVLSILIFRTFNWQKDALERGSSDADLLRQMALTEAQLGNLLRRAGSDPCHSRYWDPEAPAPVNDQVSYFAVHPWGVKPWDNSTTNPFLSLSPGIPNPMQAVVVHFDYETNNCAINQRIGHRPGYTHYRPLVKAGSVHSGYAIFVNNMVDYPGGGANAFVSCPQPELSGNPLLKVPVAYSSDLNSMTLDCQGAEILARQVECFFIEYVQTTRKEDETCSTATCEYHCNPDSNADAPNSRNFFREEPDPAAFNACRNCLSNDTCLATNTCCFQLCSSHACRLRADRYDFRRAVKAVNKARITLTLGAARREAGYDHPDELTICQSNDPLRNFTAFRSGRSLHHLEYRTLTKTFTIDLTNTSYR